MSHLVPAIALACASLLAPLAASAQQAPVQERPRAVLELFTSQGCSSCPPADRLMAELAKDPEIAVLSLPVDYWDYLGWKDTLAQSAFTFRQKAYSATRGDRQVYTPQAVINGVTHVVGSDRGQIEKAFVSARSSSGAMPLALALVNREGGMAVECPSRPSDAQPAHLWALPFVKERAVQIGRGENGGRSVTYINVVRSVTRIGECRSGAASQVDLPASSLPAEADGIVILLQGGGEKKPARILAAVRHMVR